MHHDPPAAIDSSLYAPVTGVRFIASFDPKKSKIALKSSINPVNSTTYIQECEAAAASSRLPPNAMSQLESHVFREHISHLQVTTYLITRNAILRLWCKNPMLWVSMEEAQGVAREERHFPLCRAIWEFLVRNGYINFGCLDVPEPEHVNKEEKSIVVIGAGVAGLCTARQIQTLLAVFHDKLKYNYKVKVLEGRGRIGGRIYSHRLKSEDVVSHVDLGAQIVTGFSGGNPLTVLLQRQLAIPYHSLVYARNNKIHGQNGLAIDHAQDVRVEGLFNLLLDAAARYRLNLTDLPKTEDGGSHVAVADKVLGVGKAVGPDAAVALAANPLDELRRLGYTIKENSQIHNVPEAKSLGETMSATLSSYEEVAEIPKGDLDILSWHWANMEYACGTSLENLSLRFWDQDDGNEFRGHHAMIVGGYSQLARGLALAPTKLDITTQAEVDRIVGTQVVLKDGNTYEADKVVLTVPLGVLKHNSIAFEPALPAWKQYAINNLGFGLLNKVVLAYDEQFWEHDIDLIGSVPADIGTDSAHSRGRFYMFWNCTQHASGRPVLVALMAGQAAYACENTENEVLVKEATVLLQRTYPNKQVREPVESIVTRWEHDPFSRGSYSYIGTDGSGADHDLLAKPVGDSLFFAGEATCRTHPSTVHGAYLSGLSAAKAVLDTLIGEQVISADKPLVPIKAKVSSSSTSARSDSKKRKFDVVADSGERFRNEKDKYNHLKKARLAKEKEALQNLILERIGVRPEQPKRTNANPFLIFQKDQWNACKAIADEAQQTKLKDPNAKASKNQIRACLGQTWRDTSEEGKRPWVEKVAKKREEYETTKKEWELAIAKYDADSIAITKEFDESVRPTLVTDEEKQCLAAINASKPENGDLDRQPQATPEVNEDNDASDSQEPLDEDEYKPIRMLEDEED